MSELFVLRDLGGLEMIQVVPDGCDDFLVLFDQGRAHSYLSSSLAESHRFTFPAAKGLVGIRFQPGATANFLGEDMAQVAGQTLSMKDIWGDFGQVEERLAAGIWPRGSLGSRTICSERSGRTQKSRSWPNTALPSWWPPVVTTRWRPWPSGWDTPADISVSFFPPIWATDPRSWRRFSGPAPSWGAPGAAPPALGDVALLCGFADQSHMNRGLPAVSGGPGRGHPLWGSLGNGPGFAGPSPVSMSSDLFYTPLLGDGIIASQNKRGDCDGKLLHLYQPKLSPAPHPSR